MTPIQGHLNVFNCLYKQDSTQTEILDGMRPICAFAFQFDTHKTTKQPFLVCIPYHVGKALTHEQNDNGMDTELTRRINCICCITDWLKDWLNLCRDVKAPM